MRWLARLLPALILLTLVSCGDSAIFLTPVEEPAELEVQTIDAGSIVAPGSALPLFIQRDPVFTGDAESADRLLVELLDTDGILLAEQAYESVDQADELPDLELPDIGEGLFVLRTSYYDGDDLVQSKDTPFFITDAQYYLHGLSSFPATLYPGSAGLLSLTMDAPFGSDPYLEWFLDDELISAGHVSQTGTMMEVGAPDEVGAYSVRVDLFPVAPSGEEPVPAPVSYGTELLVSTESPLDQTSLTPERSYYVLYHFLGDLRDSGARVGLFGADEKDISDRAVAVGDPTLALESDSFGYRLDGDDGFLIDGFVLPARDGRLTPFSVTFRIRPEGFDTETTMLAIDLPDANVFAIGTSRDGGLTFEADGTRVSTSSPVLSLGVTSVVTLSLIPVDDRALIQFYVDGVSVLSEVVDWDVQALELPDALAEDDDGWTLLPGEALLGGEGGFVGLLDEFGVYFRDDGDQPSQDTDIFQSAMEQVHGEKLVYAEGFESPKLPDLIHVTGETRVERGRLVLGVRSTAAFPAFVFSAEELYVLVSLDALAGSRIVFTVEGQDEPLVDFLSSEFDVDPSSLDFLFVHSDSELLIVSPDGSEQSFALDPGLAFDGLQLEVRQTAAQPAEVAIQSVVAWREYPEMPASLFEPDESMEPESPAQG